MKLHTILLEKIIDLPSGDTNELRQLLDDVGLEVKDIDLAGTRPVFNIETLANRGDHLSALGVARELSGRLLTSIKLPPLAATLSDRKTAVPVTVRTPRCLRYALMEMQLPQEMKLRSDIAAVIRDADPARHTIVHLLNYILLEIGQPMHAFDREKVDGEVRIELSDKSEQIVALDGKTYTVPADSVMIRDRSKTIAVAGVIGCANSMVTPTTKNVLIESALFDPVSVRKTARGLQLSTDASYTFERGGDIELAVTALKRLAYLASSGAGGDDGARVIGLSVVEGSPTEKRRVTLGLEKLRAQLNLPRLASSEVAARLKNLGYSVELDEEKEEVRTVVPSWRLFEVQHEQDLIEDFARAHGLNRVKLELPPLDPDLPELSEEEKIAERVEPVLHGNGFYEVITKVFYAAEEVALIGELEPKRKDTHVTVKNAVEQSNSHLRLTALIHHYRLADANHRHGTLAFKAYEIGRLFSTASPYGNSPYQFEHEVLALSASGRWYEGEWRGAEELKSQIAKFKGVLEGLFESLGVELSVAKSESGLFHPGYQGLLKVGRHECGIFGVAHPLIRDRLGCKFPLLHAEISLPALIAVAKPREFLRPVDYPSIRRDITLKLPDKELAGRVSKIIHEAKPAHLVAVTIVDDFKKESEAFRRVSYRLTFQSAERTLAHQDVDGEMSRVLELLKSEHAFELAA